MGFNMLFYIIFGTNLLTEGLVQIAVFFCLFQCFAEKVIKWNETFARIFLGTNATQETWSGSQGINKAATRQEGAPRGVSAPPTSWLPRLLLDVHSKSSRSRLFRKSRSRRFHSVWTPFDILFLRNPEIGKKNINLGWASG